MEKNELERLKLEIVLAGLEVPEKKKETLEKKFEYIISLGKEDQRKAKELNEKYEKDNKNYIEVLVQTAKKARNKQKEDKICNVIGFKALFIAKLEEIASEASFKRHLEDNISADMNWRLKARTWLFREAKRMIEEISTDCTCKEFKRAVYTAMTKKDRENDWGWGTNWSDVIHRETMEDVRKEIKKFLSNIKGIYSWENRKI